MTITGWSILGWLLLVVIIGIVAQFFVPKRYSAEWIVPILLSFSGAYVGGFLSMMLSRHHDQETGWIGSIIGSIALCVAYCRIASKRGYI